MRILDCLAVFAFTFGAHLGSWFVLFLGSQVVLNPVGSGKMQFFSVVVVPGFLLLFGRLQGRSLFIVHAVAVLILGLAVWRYPSAYDPSRALQPLSKELSWYSMSIGMGVWFVCSLISGALNSFRRWEGHDLELDVPFRGKIVYWSNVTSTKGSV